MQTRLGNQYRHRAAICRSSAHLLEGEEDHKQEHQAELLSYHFCSPAIAIL